MGRCTCGVGDQLVLVLVLLLPDTIGCRHPAEVVTVGEGEEVVDVCSLTCPLELFFNETRIVQVPGGWLLLQSLN